MSSAELRRKLLKVVLPLWLLGGTSLVGAQAVVPAEYRLHAGDKLDVSVWKEVEMQRPAVVIAPDGNRSFNLSNSPRWAMKLTHGRECEHDLVPVEIRDRERP